MAVERYVVAGVGRPRATWFRDVARWSTAAAVPCEFVMCVSIDELRARLAGGRTFSAVLVDAGVPGVDRDLIATAREAGAAVLVVDGRRGGTDWIGLGAGAVLGPDLTREALLDALALHATPVRRSVVTAVAGGEADDVVADGPTGPLIAVCGPGGTGASTVAVAVAEGLARRRGGEVVLADLCRHAEQAMLHDVRDVTPGVQELVELHRGRQPAPEEVRALTFEVVDRGYRLLLGLRRARYWSALPPRAVTSAVDSLRHAFGAVVVDVDADLEGEAEGGSIDVEERNAMARTAVGAADVVVAVGAPGVKGVHALVRLLGDLTAAGVPAGRMLPVVNRAPRTPRARAELARALAELAPAGALERCAPVFLPVRKVEEALRDAVPLPAPLPALLAGGCEAVLSRPARGGRPAPGPERVEPGSLGAWYEEEAS
jgi:MinD-like ATPase involved in chromosome partitioning or flagellar assembly